MMSSPFSGCSFIILKSSTVISVAWLSSDSVCLLTDSYAILYRGRMIKRGRNRLSLMKSIASIFFANFCSSAFMAMYRSLPARPSTSDWLKTFLSAAPSSFALNSLKW